MLSAHNGDQAYCNAKRFLEAHGYQLPVSHTNNLRPICPLAEARVLMRIKGFRSVSAVDNPRVDGPKNPA